ncbi:hypothetical protein GBO49_09420 [Pediococcus acidilactici]|nr:hypothetical protein GBO49_09420 [Pediococcus acidilactici]
MRAKAAPPNPDPPGTPMSPFVCVLYRHWLTYYCNLRNFHNQQKEAKKSFWCIVFNEAETCAKTQFILLN